MTEIKATMLVSCSQDVQEAVFSIWSDGKLRNDTNMEWLCTETAGANTIELTVIGMPMMWQSVNHVRIRRGDMFVMERGVCDFTFEGAPVS